MAEQDSAFKAFVGLLENINEQVRDVRERLIRLESHGYAERLNKLDEGVDGLKNRVTVLETRGQGVTAVISAGAAVLTTLVASAIMYLFGR